MQKNKKNYSMHENFIENKNSNKLFSIIITIVKPEQAGTCGRSIRNEHISKSLICTNIKYYRTYSIYSLSGLYAILLSITKKTARKWTFGIVDDAACSAHKCQLVLVSL